MNNLTLKLSIIAVALSSACFGLVGCSARTDKGVLRAAFDAEFYTRPDGYAGLCAYYGFKFPSTPQQMDPGLMYKAAEDGAVDVIDGFATDGRIAAYHLVTLKDDKHFFPPYYAAPLIRDDTLKKYPKIADALNMLAGKIDDDTMRKLNYEVDEKGRKASTVAREFLETHHLIPDHMPHVKRTGVVTIGGKQFTEQEILGQLAALLIEAHTSLHVQRKLNLGGTMICFNALKAGDLDCYIEYTGTGLVDILKDPVSHDPQQTYNEVKRQFEKDYRLTWLKPIGFNNTYTLTMRQKEANRLGIHTISDLAAYIKAHKR